LVVPESVARQLGLTTSDQASVRYADGRTAQRPLARGVHLTWGDRSGVFSAIVEPDRDSALIGAIVLEDLDLIIDCTTQTLRPRDPKQIVSEIE
jgi:predicted aspartyl protease